MGRAFHILLRGAWPLAGAAALVWCGGLWAAQPPACPHAQVSIQGYWMQPTGYLWAADSELKEGEWARISAQPLFRHQADLGVQCLRGDCRLCILRIRGSLGFKIRPPKMSPVLRQARCAMHRLLDHEMAHAQAYRLAEAAGLRAVRLDLRRFAGRQAQLVHPAAGLADWRERLGADLFSLMSETYEAMRAAAGNANGQLDSPASYVRLTREIMASCPMDARRLMPHHSPDIRPHGAWAQAGRAVGGVHPAAP